MLPSQQPDDEKVGPRWSVKHTGPNRAQRRAMAKQYGYDRMPSATNRPVAAKQIPRPPD